MAHFDHFDFLAPLYDRLIKPTDPKKMISLLGLPVNGILLDVGGGTGRSSHELKDSVSGTVIADASLGMLVQAVKKGRQSITCSNSEKLPFAGDTFERVIMVDALHHVSDYQDTLDELWRVTKPGGRIVIEEPDIQTFPVKIMAVVEKLALMRSHLISPLLIKNCFKAANSVSRIEREGTTAWVIIEKQAR